VFPPAIIRAAFAAAVISQLTPGMAADQPPVPEKWEGSAHSVTDANAVASRCNMNVSESEWQRMFSGATPGSLTVRRPSERTKPYLVVTSKRVICVQVSPKGYPIVPLEVFEKTVDFDGMMSDMWAQLRANLARQLAARGVASALVKNDKGNATQLTYMFAADQHPTRIYYQATFLKAGEFDEARFETVLTAPGGFGVTMRGPSSGPGEGMKGLFAE